uniref:Uncharacterized protein n=1 Tax=Photinus pyralis TaxID=7054 RepID=A0A1Y1KZM5_PHOPY
MEYTQKATAIFLLLIIFGLISNSFQTKKVNCRKYVYAPVCRGVQAKRALPALDNESLSIREPRGQPITSELDTIMHWKDKDRAHGYDTPPLQLLLKKLNPGNSDYEYVEANY